MPRTTGAIHWMGEKRVASSSRLVRIAPAEQPCSPVRRFWLIGAPIAFADSLLPAIDAQAQGLTVPSVPQDVVATPEDGGQPTLRIDAMTVGGMAGRPERRTRGSSTLEPRVERRLVRVDEFSGTRCSILTSAPSLQRRRRAPDCPSRRRLPSVFRATRIREARNRAVQMPIAMTGCIRGLNPEYPGRFPAPT